MYDMYDYHLHSTHSGDGKVPDIVQAMAAIERGVTEICFTDHFDCLLYTSGNPALLFRVAGGRKKVFGYGLLSFLCRPAYL